MAVGRTTTRQWTARDVEVTVTSSHRVLAKAPCGKGRFMEPDEAIALAKKIFNAASLAKANKQRAEGGNISRVDRAADSKAAAGAMAEALAENG